MHAFKNVLVVLALALLAGSCNKVDFKKSKSGMPYKLYANEKGAKAAGKWVKMGITSQIKDSSMMNTYNSLPVYLEIDSSRSQPYDPSELFGMLREGDSLYTVQMIDTFIKQDPTIAQRTRFRNGDKIISTFKVMKVFASQEEAMADKEKLKTAMTAREEEVIKEHLKKSGVQAQRTGNGVYVAISNPGTGAQADTGKYVSLMYRGQTLAGKVFDTNMDTSFKHTDPLNFVLGQGATLPGFEEGIKTLREGGKARVYIPSTLAYGDKSPSPDLPAYSHLVFDIELLKVSDKAPPAPPQMQMTPEMQQQLQQQMQQQQGGGAPQQ